MITITTSGMAAVVRHFQEMRQRADELSPAWEEFLTWWAQTNREQFTSRGTRWRSPWPALSPSTQRQKKRAGFLSEPLVRTTELRSELVGRPLGVEHIRADEVDAGTDISYAKFHQKGTRKMPRRRIVNAQAVAQEGAASSVIISWIIDGEPNVGGHRWER